MLRLRRYRRPRVGILKLAAPSALKHCSRSLAAAFIDSSQQQFPQHRRRAQLAANRLVMPSGLNGWILVPGDEDNLSLPLMESASSYRAFPRILRSNTAMSGDRSCAAASLSSTLRYERTVQPVCSITSVVLRFISASSSNKSTCAPARTSLPSLDMSLSFAAGLIPPF